MTDNTHDDARLIETLRGLIPTEGEWVHSEFSGEIVAYVGQESAEVIKLNEFEWRNDYTPGFDIRYPNPDNLALFMAAPAMRALILRQADELAAVKAQLAAVRGQQYGYVKVEDPNGNDLGWVRLPVPPDAAMIVTKPNPHNNVDTTPSLWAWDTLKFDDDDAADADQPAPRLAGDGPL